MSASAEYVAYDADIASVGALIADPTRAAILTALIDGRPLAAGELARLARVSAPTASSHLARLLAGGMVTVTAQGRHRYYRLAGHEVAAVLESIARVSPRRPIRSLRQSRQAASLRSARTCYDHLAGRAGVLLLAALIDSEILEGASRHKPAARRDGARTQDARTQGARIQGAGTQGAGTQGAGTQDGRTQDGRTQDARIQNARIQNARSDLIGIPIDSGEGVPGRVYAHPAGLTAEFDVTSTGERELAAFGVDVAETRRLRRRFAAECLDWTERKPHLSGALGAAITARLIELGWFERDQVRRALRLTEAGRDGLTTTFGCVLDDAFGGSAQPDSSGAARDAAGAAGDTGGGSAHPAGDGSVAAGEAAGRLRRETARRRMSA